jgi:hypothetical protein
MNMEKNLNMQVENNNGKQAFGEHHKCVMEKLGNITNRLKTRKKNKTLLDCQNSRMCDGRIWKHIGSTQE